MNDPRNFAEMVDLLHNIGLVISDNESNIVISIYDYMEGRTLIKELAMDEYDAVELFGSYTIFDLRIQNGRMAFTLNVPRNHDDKEESQDK